MGNAGRYISVETGPRMKIRPIKIRTTGERVVTGASEAEEVDKSTPRHDRAINRKTGPSVERSPFRYSTPFYAL